MPPCCQVGRQRRQVAVRAAKSVLVGLTPSGRWYHIYRISSGGKCAALSGLSRVEQRQRPRSATICSGKCVPGCDRTKQTQNNVARKRRLCSGPTQRLRHCCGHYSIFMTSLCTCYSSWPPARAVAAVGFPATPGTRISTENPPSCAYSSPCRSPSHHHPLILDGIVPIIELVVARQHASDQRHQAEDDGWQEHVRDGEIVC